MTAPVSFVSSGPGDPELLTLRAVRRIEAAEAILFDDLSAGPILELADPGADLVAVGKRAGRPSPDQSHVSRLLVDYARTGQRVVRLKSGDAGIFGRLEEEIRALDAAGIRFEIVPGVTAGSAAAAAAGLPLTRRLTARRVQFVTGHDATGALPEGLDIAALSDPGATTIVYMGRRTFARLARQLVAAGLPPDTPALLAEAVSTPAQRLDRSTVVELARALDTAPAEGPPAVILFGPLADPSGPDRTGASG